MDRRAMAVYGLTEGKILGAVEIPAEAERIFQALTGPEVRKWWVNPGVFDTTEWNADVRPGGRWHAAGTGRGHPYTLEGEFVEVEAARKLIHTWRSGPGPGGSVVTCMLHSAEGGTRLTLRQDGITDRATLVRTCTGWETSLEALSRLLSTQ